MKSSIDISSLGKSIATFFKRFHTILFFLIVSGGLFTAIVMLLGIIALSDTKATTSTQTIDRSFDDDTIKRLKDKTPVQASPGSRPSPFAE